MRFFFLIPFFLISLNTFCQKSKEATIIFNTTKVKLAKGMYIEIQKYQRDSSPNYIFLKRINFDKLKVSSRMKVDEPLDCRMFLKINDSILYISNPFYITNEMISVSFDTIAKELIIRSKQNDFYQKNDLVYLSMPATIVNDYGFSYSLLKNAYELPLFPFEKYILRLKILEYENNVMESVRINKSFYRTLTALYNIRSELTPKTLETCYEILKPYWQNTIVFKQLTGYVSQEKKIFIGKQFPLFTLLNKELKECQSTSFYPQYDFTFIDFWASWCGPCRAQTKRIQGMYNKIDTSIVQIVSVSIDEDKKKWTDAVKQDSISWSNYIDTKGGWSGNSAKNFNLIFIPSNVIVDKTGKIVALNVSVEGLKDFMVEHGAMKKSD